VGPRNRVLDGVQIPVQWAILRGMSSGFSRTLLSTIASGPVVRISLHNVDQMAGRRSSRVSHKIFPMKNPPCNASLQCHCI